MTCSVLPTSFAGQTPSGSTLAKPSETSDATISGRVVNAITGKPIWRALVRFNDRAMFTGHNGAFEFGQITDATGSLQANKPGFYANIDPGGPTGIFLHTDQIDGPLELRLYPEAIFTGTVTAADGDPLPHVIVSAKRSMFDESGHRWVPGAQGQTDSHGRFRLPVAPGDYRLESMYVPRIRGTAEAALPSAVPSETSSNSPNFIHIHSGEEQSFDLHPVTSQAHMVTVTFDSVLAGGFPRITARSSKGLTIPMQVSAARSGIPEGMRLELPSGTYTLTATIASPDGTMQGQTTVTVADHDLSGVMFHLSPVPILPVELLVDGAGTSDNPQPRLQQFGLVLENSDSDSNVFDSTVRLAMRRDTTADFTVPPGSYRLRARNSGAWHIKAASYGTSDLLRQDLVIGPGAGGTPIRITVSAETADLEGTCKLSGVPTACTVYLVPSTPSARSVFVLQGNMQGQYSDAYLPPGTYQAVAFEQRHSADYDDPATLVPFATHIRTITVNAGDKPTLDLDTVSAAEMAP